VVGRGVDGGRDRQAPGFGYAAVNSFVRREKFPHRPNQRERNEELVFQCMKDGMSQCFTANVLGVTRTFVGNLVRDRDWRFPVKVTDQTESH
jgi:hypothetical protein